MPMPILPIHNGQPRDDLPSDTTRVDVLIAAATATSTEPASGSALLGAQQQDGLGTAAVDERTSGESMETVILENTMAETRDAECVAGGTVQTTMTPSNGVWTFLYVLFRHTFRWAQSSSPLDVRTRSRSRFGRVRCLVSVSLVIISAFVIVSNTISPPNGE